MPLAKPIPQFAGHQQSRPRPIAQSIGQTAPGTKQTSGPFAIPMRRANPAVRLCSSGEAGAAKRKRRTKRTMRTMMIPAQMPLPQSHIAATIVIHESRAQMPIQAKDDSSAAACGLANCFRSFCGTTTYRGAFFNFRAFITLVNFILIHGFMCRSFRNRKSMSLIQSAHCLYWVRCWFAGNLPLRNPSINRNSPDGRCNQLYQHQHSQGVRQRRLLPQHAEIPISSPITAATIAFDNPIPRADSTDHLVRLGLPVFPLPSESRHELSSSSIKSHSACRSAAESGLALKR